jgi:hypothetical protein
VRAGSIRSGKGCASIRTLTAGVVLAGALGCAEFGQIATAVDEALYETVPTHPVTGQPMVTVVSEEQEIAQAKQLWQQLEAAAMREGIAVDPAGPRLERVRSAFNRLVRVAHRQWLPWEAHLVSVPESNALAAGGGLVVVFDDLFGGLIPTEDDDALAAVLAHEIAHNTLLHVPGKQSWQLIGPIFSDRTDEPYYQAAYTTEQEADADRLAALYTALAGFDPMAAPRIWAEAHRQHGSSGAASGYLYNHPLNAERVQITVEAAQLVAQYRVPGEQNPNWAEILADNPLFPRARTVGRAPGTGIFKALGAAAGAAGEHRQAVEGQRQREQAAAMQAAVRIVRVWEAPTADGYVGLFFEVHNGTRRPVTGLQLQVNYWGAAQQLVGTDPSCAIAVVIPPGGSATTGCYKRDFPGATQTSVGVVEATFQ